MVVKLEVDVGYRGGPGLIYALVPDLFTLF
jgi:hypothetical protein